MMTTWLFIFQYGALFLVGLFLAPFWGCVAFHRAGTVDHKWPLHNDRYFILAAAIAVLAVGDTLVFGARTFGYIRFGIDYILYDRWHGAVLAAGLAIIMLGKGMLVWLADLEKEPPVWTWTRWGVVITFGWAVFAAVTELLWGLA